MKTHFEHKIVIVELLGMGRVKRISYYGIIILIFMGMIGGSLFANIYWVDNVGKLGVFDLNYVEKMQQMRILWKDLFRYIVCERVKVWLFVLLLSYTCFGGILRWGCIGFLGALWGFEGSCFVMTHGIKGLFYFTILCLITQGIYAFSLVWSMQNSRRKERSVPEQIGMVLMIPLLLIILSSLLEAIVNLSFLKIL